MTRRTDRANLGVTALVAIVLVISSMRAHADHDRLVGFATSPEAHEADLALPEVADEWAQRTGASARSVATAEIAREMRREFGQQRTEWARTQRGWAPGSDSRPR